MPDGTGGLAAGVYWVITGKMPIEDLEDDEADDDPKREDDDDPLMQKDKKGR